MSLDRALVEEVALNIGISEAFVEKDWHVTQVIKLLVENPHPDFAIVFTGALPFPKHTS
ncbi:hypothetical protein GCM10023187_34910 [Nibrella viscosa]|uniref:Uncharacterized protein n=1 Tax=Nibrella viscosa TaxID=1084524 RepID=A0ABP8KNQ8_9BACT